VNLFLELGGLTGLILNPLWLPFILWAAVIAHVRWGR
jgi:hypothetical protein